jgi:hypothetical protein
LLAESSLLLSALEGKQTAKAEKVAALVPRVENEIEMPAAQCAESCNLARGNFISKGSEPVRFILRTVLISFGGSAMLTKRSRFARESMTGGIYHAMDSTSF